MMPITTRTAASTRSVVRRRLLFLIGPYAPRLGGSLQDFDPGGPSGTLKKMDAATLPSFARQRLDPEQRYGLRLTLFAIAVVLVFVPFGFLLSQVVDEGPMTVYDRAVVEELHDVVREHPGTIGPLQFVSFLGKPIFFYILVGAACVFLLIRQRRRLVAYLIATGLGGGAVDTAVKVIVSRDRPVLEDPVATAFGQSFP